MRKFQDLSCCLDAGLEPAFFFYRIFPVDWLLHSTLLSNLLKRKEGLLLHHSFLGRFAFRVTKNHTKSNLKTERIPKFSLLVSLTNTFLFLRLDETMIKEWHEGFLQDCPSGKLKPDTFIAMYKEFFPASSKDAEIFSRHVYR